MTDPSLPFQQSCWIGGPSWTVDCGGEINRYYAYRKNLELPAAPVQALVRLTADARYILWVNGHYVGRGPARCFPDHQCYDTWDIGPLLRAGTNWIACLVHQFGMPNGQYLYRGRTGLLLEGYAAHAAGEKQLICSDLTWQVRMADWYGHTFARLSQHMGFQERYDARLEPPDWRCPPEAATALADPAWSKPFYVGPIGCAPWTKLEPRGVAPMAETVVRPEHLTWAASGCNAPEAFTADNLRLAWVAEQRERLAALPSLDAEGWIEVPPAPENGFTALALDYGWNHAAYPQLQVRGAVGGEVIDHFFCTGYSAGEPVPNRGFGRPYEGMADRTIVAPEASIWEAFLPHGYRHHVVQVRANPRTLHIRVTARRTHHAVKALDLTCSDATLNRIWQITDRTLRASMLDGFIDSNSREQVQWMYDGGCFPALGAWATYGDATLWRRCLRLWGQSQGPSGALEGYAPAEAAFVRPPEMTMSWLDSLWHYYQYTADHQLLQECWPIVRRIVLDLVAPNMTSEGLFVQPEGHWVFLDWAPLDLRPYSLTLNLFILLGIRRAQSLARAAQAADGELEEVCRHWNKRITETVESRFWSDAQGAWLDHIEAGVDIQTALARRPAGWLWNVWKKEEPKGYFPCVPHSNALAVLLKLGTPEQQAGAAALVARSLVPHQQETCNVALLHHLAFSALFEGGLEEQALEAFQNHHGQWIADGATVWAEGFKAGEDSAAHSCGTSVNWVISRYILGIRPTKPGFEEAVFDPRPGHLTAARGVVPTPHGEIRVAWTRAVDGRIKAEIVAPTGVTLHIEH